MEAVVAALVALDALVIAGAFFFVRHLMADHAAQRAEWAADSRQLLDRVMSRDYETYAAVRRADAAAPGQPELSILDDDDEADIEERLERVA